MPERWKPHITAGVLQWLPAFEAAGFSNAIRVLERAHARPGPDWSPEDPTINVIRWVTEEKVNAMGPHIVDPRSGEVLSAHIHIWPSVIDFFGQYYWSLFGGSGVDPARRSAAAVHREVRRAAELRVAHEVGHTLGLMHNQIASTAHTVAQMRDPAFANRAGPNSSIMAYGRFNHAAQPGDGVTQLWGTIGPYDVAAIRYGYGVFGSDRPASAASSPPSPRRFSRDRSLYFGQRGRRRPAQPLRARPARADREHRRRAGGGHPARRGQPAALAGRGSTRAPAAMRSCTARPTTSMLGRHVALLKSVNRLLGRRHAAAGRRRGPDRPAGAGGRAARRGALPAGRGRGLAGAVCRAGGRRARGALRRLPRHRPPAGRLVTGLLDGPTSPCSRARGGATRRPTRRWTSGAT
jgi:hypothetical protein